MKKLILPIIALSMLVTGCIGGDVYESPSGGVYESDLELISKTITIRPDQWEVDGNPGEEGAVLVSEWALRELTQDVIDNGMVQVSYAFVGIRGNLVLHPLPYILPYQGNPAAVLETYRCSPEKGILTFYIEDSDFQCYIPEQPLTFKVQILRHR